MKKGFRKKLKASFERSLRRILLGLFSSSDWKVQRYSGNSKFGSDDLGRDIEDGLKRYVTILRQRSLKINTVIVLGSRAKGSWIPRSDIDVTVIADNLPREGRNAITFRLFDLKRRVVLSDRPLYIGVEPSGCCTKGQFLKRLKRFDIRALDAIFFGKVIYDDGFWPEALGYFSKLDRTCPLPEEDLRRLLKPL